MRRDHYVVGEQHPALLTAVRIGGRLTCVAAVAELCEDAFVFTHDHIHVHVDRDRSRLRGADGSTSWSRRTAGNVRVRWGELAELPAGRHVVALVDAVRCLITCIPEREVIASLDSLLRVGAITAMQVREVFATLPRRYAHIPALLDRRSESGSESFLRLILRELGVDYEVQVVIRGVGRVDFVVASFLIIECDSKAHHQGWEKQREDRRRDLAAAARGYVTLRPLAEDLFFRPERVVAAVSALLRTHAVLSLH